MKKNNCFQTILPVACKLLLLILIFQTLVFTQESDELCSLSQLLEGIEGGREVQRPFYSNEISDVYNDHFVIHYTDGSCMTFN